MAARIISAAGRGPAAIAVTALCTIFIPTQCVARVAERQAETTDSRPNAPCVSIPETRGEKAKLICFSRELHLRSVPDSKSFEELRQELREELQRRADERYGMLMPPPTPADQ